MFDDSLFDALKTDNTSKLQIHEFSKPGKPFALTLKYIGESNEGYQSARKNLEMRKIEGDAKSDALDKLLAEHVIVGWENAPSKGAAIEYSPKAGHELLTRLRAVKRSDIIDRIYQHALTPSYFTAPLVDPVDLGNA